MQIRNCALTDIEQAAIIFCEAYAAPPYNEFWEVANAQAYLQRFFEIDPQGCFIAEVGSEVAGAIFSFSYPWHSGNLTCIQELFVSEACRKQGIARGLIQRLKSGGAWLVAHKGSGAAEFYRRIGFRTDGPYEFHYGAITP